MSDLEKAAFNLGEAIANFVRQAVTAQQNAQPEGEKLYGADDLAKILGKSKDTVRRWITNGEFGEPIHVGKSLCITKAALDKYLADHTGPVKKREATPRRRIGTKAGENLQNLKI